MYDPQDEKPEHTKECPICCGDGFTPIDDSEMAEKCHMCKGYGYVLDDEAAEDAAEHYREAERED